MQAEDEAPPDDEAERDVHQEELEDRAVSADIDDSTPQAPVDTEVNSESKE